MEILDRIKALLKEQHKTQKNLTDFLGLKKNNFSEWNAGRSESYKTRLPEIALFLNVSIDYLVGFDQTSKTRSQSDQEMLDRITECFDLCDGPRKAALCVKAEELAKETQNQVKQTS